LRGAILGRFILHAVTEREGIVKQQVVNAAQGLVPEIRKEQIDEFAEHSSDEK